MKKIILATILALSTTALFAKETKLLPILNDADYCLTPGVAVLGGFGSYGDADSDAMYGVELSIACPALQLSTLDIKQQISLVYQSQDGFDATALEFNPHVMFDLSNNLQVGVGPGFGVIFADAQKSDTVFEVGAGASLNYDITQSMFIGLETRYMFTTDAELVTGTKTDLNNYRTLLKAGIHF